MLTHLLLMRHAKSSWADVSLSDHDRPLNKRGRKSADRIAEVLTARGYAPDIIWSSDSTRTKETASRMIRVIPGAQIVHYFSEFYHASVEDVLEVCQRETLIETMSFKRLMLLGHNPGWSSLYEYFCAGRPQIASAFPTAACAVFARKTELEASWVMPEAWRLIDLLQPRDFETQDAE